MHKSIMINELTKFIDINPNGLYVDSTFGIGGHSKEILKYLNLKSKLFIFDKDFISYCYAKNIFLNDKRVNFFFSSFENINHFFNKENYLDGIICDLGLSLDQLRDKSKGFGFKSDGFLDMRVNFFYPFRIIDWFNLATEKDLNCFFNLFYNKKYIFKIVKKILIYRKFKVIKTTRELCNIIFTTNVLNKNKILTKFFHFARVFINNDFFLLICFLEKCLNLLKSGGILILLSFNSFDDNIIKNFIFKNENKIKFMTFKPSIFEIDFNLSSRSALMQIIKKL